MDKPAFPSFFTGFSPFFIGVTTCCITAINVAMAIVKIQTVAVTIYVLFLVRIRLRLHGAIYRPDSFVLMLRYCATLKVIRYKSTNLNRIIADESHRVIVAFELWRRFPQANV